jgi:hypothetical protein
MRWIWKGIAQWIDQRSLTGGRRISAGRGI